MPFERFSADTENKRRLPAHVNETRSNFTNYWSSSLNFNRVFRRIEPLAGRRQTFPSVFFDSIFSPALRSRVGVSIKGFPVSIHKPLRKKQKFFLVFRSPPITFRSRPLRPIGPPARAGTMYAIHPWTDRYGAGRDVSVRFSSVVSAPERGLGPFRRRFSGPVPSRPRSRLPTTRQRVVCWSAPAVVPPSISFDLSQAAATVHASDDGWCARQHTILSYLPRAVGASVRAAAPRANKRVQGGRTEIFRTADVGHHCPGGGKGVPLDRVRSRGRTLTRTGHRWGRFRRLTKHTRDHN